MCDFCVEIWLPIFSASEVFTIVKLVSNVSDKYLLKQNWLLVGVYDIVTEKK